MKQETPAQEVADLLTRLQPAVQGYALAITADHDLAQEVFQEVAALVTQDPGAVPSGTGALAWLREVARRKSLEALRRERREQRVLSSDVLDQIADAFEPHEETSALAERLAECVEKLATEHRTILAGRYENNLSAEEIGQRVGRSVQGVYAVLKRVRRALADCMRGVGHQQAATGSPEEDPPRSGVWNEAMS